MVNTWRRVVWTGARVHSPNITTTDNYVKCPCNNFIKRHFNQYFVNNNNNSRVQGCQKRQSRTRTVNTVVILDIRVHWPWTRVVWKGRAGKKELSCSAVPRRRSCVGEASLAEFNTCPWSLIFASTGSDCISKVGRCSFCVYFVTPVKQGPWTRVVCTGL